MSHPDVRRIAIKNLNRLATPKPKPTSSEDGLYIVQTWTNYQVGFVCYKVVKGLAYRTTLDDLNDLFYKDVSTQGRCHTTMIAVDGQEVWTDVTPKFLSVENVRKNSDRVLVLLNGNADFIGGFDFVDRWLKNLEEEGLKYLPETPIWYNLPNGVKPFEVGTRISTVREVLDLDGPDFSGIQIREVSLSEGYSEITSCADPIAVPKRLAQLSEVPKMLLASSSEGHAFRALMFQNGSDFAIAAPEVAKSGRWDGHMSRVEAIELLAQWCKANGLTPTFTDVNVGWGACVLGIPRNKPALGNINPDSFQYFKELSEFEPDDLDDWLF